MRAILFTALLLATSAAFAQDRAALFAAAAAAKARPAPSVRGDDLEWYFPTREVKHLGTGRFWEQPWEAVAANKTDPVAGIVEFHALLKERGIPVVNRLFPSLAESTS